MSTWKTFTSFCSKFIQETVYYQISPESRVLRSHFFLDTVYINHCTFIHFISFAVVLQIQASAHHHWAGGRPHRRHHMGSSIRGSTWRSGGRYWDVLRGVRDVRSPAGRIGHSAWETTTARRHGLFQQPASVACPSRIPAQRRSASSTRLLRQHWRVQESTVRAGDTGWSWECFCQTRLQSVLVVNQATPHRRQTRQGYSKETKDTHRGPLHFVPLVPLPSLAFLPSPSFPSLFLPLPLLLSPHSTPFLLLEVGPLYSW